MKYPVDLNLFNRISHNPSYRSLQKSMGPTDLKIIDFCIPVNSYFPTQELIQNYADNIFDILKYYPGDNEKLSAIVAGVFGYDPETLLLFNGATEIATILNANFLDKCLCTPVPTWGRWTDQPLELGKKVVFYERKEETNYKLDPKDFSDFVLKSGADAAVVCNPNNPTGSLLSHAEVVEILDRLQSLKLIIIDEAFIDFSYLDSKDIPTVSQEAVNRENVIVVKSLGKNLGLHGIRLGYALASKRFIQRLNVFTPKWNVNGMAEALINDLESHFAVYEQARKKQIQDRFYLEKRLSEVTFLKAFPSVTNFVYVKLPDNITGKEFRNRLITNHGCLVRACADKVGSNDQFLRIAVRPKEQTDKLIEALKSEL